MRIAVMSFSVACTAAHHPGGRSGAAVRTGAGAAGRSATRSYSSARYCQR